MRVGVDVGGTKTDAVAVAPDGEIVARVRRATGWGRDAVVSGITGIVGELAVAVGMPASGFASLGLGIPGQVDPLAGRVTHAVNLGLDRLDLTEAIGAAFGIPVHIENDVKAAALGAWSLHPRMPSAPAADTIGYLNLGTGVAAGFVGGGRLWRGRRGTAGEIGHISVDPAGPACRCGQRGCIEALAGGGVIAERWGRGGALPVRDVFDAADAGDPAAAELRAGLWRGVASAVRVLVLAADVDLVVLGGGLTALGDRLRAGVEAELAASARESPFLRSLQLTERIRMLAPGSPAAALGAALLADAAEDGDRADEEGALTHG